MQRRSNFIVNDIEMQMYKFWPKCSHVDEIPLAVIWFIWFDIITLMLGQRYIYTLSNINDPRFIIWKYSPEVFITIVGMNASNISCLLIRESISIICSILSVITTRPNSWPSSSMSSTIKSTNLTMPDNYYVQVEYIITFFILAYCQFMKSISVEQCICTTCSIDVIFTLSNWIRLMRFHLTKAHYSDVIMGAMASQFTSHTIVYSTLYSGADQRKHQSSASLAFVWGIHRWPVNSPAPKWPVTRNIFPFDNTLVHAGLILCPVNERRCYSITSVFVSPYP